MPVRYRKVCYTEVPMHKPKPRNVPVTLDDLNQKLDFEIKRLLREKEEGISNYVSKTANLTGISRLVFTKKNGAKITLSYRLDDGGTLRFAREKQFAAPALVQKHLNVAHIGRASGDITG
jgi:hypothetical protein